MRIAAYSGGIASAYMLSLVPDADVVYFNDTLWEDEDLYRFNHDVARHFGVEIFEDSDGRDPEGIFHYKKMLGNNRVPVCSRILKAVRLQAFAKPGDTVYFGIMPDEMNRAGRIRSVYSQFGIDTVFPMIALERVKERAFEYWESAGIRKPRLYDLGFSHNNCSGGCVRAGKRSWARCWHFLPQVYEARAAVERRFNDRFGTHYSFLRDCTLDEFVEQIKRRKLYQFDDDGWQGECIGLCAVERGEE